MTSEVAFVDDQGRRAVLKRCRNPQYIEWIQREQRVLAALSDTSLPIPRVIGYHEVRTDGRAADVWLLMTHLPGESLWDIVQRSTIEDRVGHFRSLGTLLRQVHSTPPPNEFRAGPSWIDRALAQARGNLPWCDGSPELLAQLEASRPAPEREVLIHGDLALDNVLADTDGGMALIDWSGGDRGDARYDLTLALATEPELHLRDEDVGAFFEAYGRRPIDAATRQWFTNLYEFF
jgi:aminoglycoside phosphotransferase (APT) family kinase protein